MTRQEMTITGSWLVKYLCFYRVDISFVKTFANLNDFCCLLVASRPCNKLAYLRDRSAQTIARAATLRQKLQIELFVSPSQCIQTPDRAD